MTTMAVDAPFVTEQRTKAPLVRLLRSELRFMIRRPRTLVAFGVLVAAPIIAGVAMAVATDTVANNPSGDQMIDGVAALVGDNGMILPVFVLVLSMTMFLPMLSAMWSADALAGETQTGALRGLLMAPVSRVRLLGVKAFGVAVMTFLAVVVLALVGLIAGVTILGGGGMLTMSGTELLFWDSLGRIALMVVLVTLQVWAVAAVALAISAATEHPLVVMASTLGGIIIFSILNNIAALDWLHPVLLTDGWNATLADVIRDPIPTDGLMEGALRAACYIVIGYSLALARMSTKDG
jgi:ABC-2 type transport system permease protein